MNLTLDAFDHTTWTRAHDDVMVFARFAVEHLGIKADTLLDYMEKPQNWSRERNIWRALGQPTLGDAAFNAYSDWIDGLLDDTAFAAWLTTALIPAAA